MARSKKERIALNIKPDAKIMRRFEEYCEEMGQTKTTAFERIIQKHLDEHDKKKEEIKS